MSNQAKPDSDSGCGCLLLIVLLSFLIVAYFIGPDRVRIYVPCVETDQTQIYECTIK